MDLFKFVPGADPTVLEQGRAINGATSVMWTERYRDPGEFEIIAPLSSGLKQFLPLGTIISHTNTLEAMIVENHNVTDDGHDPELKITGRGLEVILEDRIVGANQVAASSILTPYTMAAANTWTQAVNLINEHISTATDVNDRYSDFSAITSLTGTGTSEARSLKRETVYKIALEILAVDNLGIRVVRRNPFGQAGVADQTHFVIHKGVDRTASVMFSWEAGDLETAEYLWSNRKYFNSAVVVGRYVNVRANTAGYSGYSRAAMVVPAEDIDGHLTTIPTGSVLTDIVNKMLVRGHATLKAQKEINLLRTDISEVAKYHYRRDYNIGDIVTVNGNFGEHEPMRVVEFVEIQDENEEKGHPTLEIPNPID